MPMKRLSEIFAELLREKGIDRIGILSKRYRKSKNKLQDVALDVLEGKGAIVEVDESTAIAWDLSGKRTDGSKYAYAPSCMAKKFKVVVSPEELRAKLPEDYPYFIIDLMHWNKHTEKEKNKVALQVAQSYGVLKDYLWSELLVLTWVNEEFKKKARFPLERVTAYEGSTAGFLKEKGIDEVVLLDPRAEEVLSERDFDVRAFIIGGIVDTGGTKKGTTAKIGETLENEGIKVRRRKITLRGDIIGVPDRINHILKILLEMLVEGKSMEEAILTVQSPLHARWRLRKELPRHKRRYLIDGKKYLVVEKELFDEYSKWLNIRWEDFVQVLRELNLIALERKRIHHLNKISVPRIINGKLYRVILLKKD